MRLAGIAFLLPSGLIASQETMTACQRSAEGIAVGCRLLANSRGIPSTLAAGPNPVHDGINHRSTVNWFPSKFLWLGKQFSNQLPLSVRQIRGIFRRLRHRYSSIHGI